MLEDPVRGNNFRLGYAEGELLYRLINEPDIDAALKKLYATTTLRPSGAEVGAFIAMLQKERLAILPEEDAVAQESQTKGSANPGLLQQLMQGNIFFRIPLIRPDAFLNRTLPWLSLLWAEPLRWGYFFSGFFGFLLVCQEIEIYLNTVSYLFTPRGGLAFLACLVLLKIGHEFAHAYAAKSMGLHVRSMGILFIVIWPLLYTDTTDVWKIPNRLRRMWVSAAGVLFELTIGGLALLVWVYLPDGILRSLMFFVSGTSLASTILINLNPFMRYDGYYLLMDFWGIDNLRPRAFAVLRHALRRLFLDWKGPAPEIHPHRQAMIVYGFLAMLYRLFIGISIAVAVYYLFFPALGLLVFASEIWLFIIYPVWQEIYSIHKNRQYLGSRVRMAVSLCAFILLTGLIVFPLPQKADIPCLLMYKGANRVVASDAGQLSASLPLEGREVVFGEPLARITSDTLNYQADQVRYDLEGVRASIKNLGSGGEQGAYRNWLLAEEKRLMAALEKHVQAVAQLDILSPITGRVVDINPDLYEGAFMTRGTYLFTVADPSSHELKAFVHENLMGDLNTDKKIEAYIRFPGPEFPVLKADLIHKSDFPINHLPNDSLLDFAGGSIVSVHDAYGTRPRDAYFTFTFEVEKAPPWIPHGIPAQIRLQQQNRPILWRVCGDVWKKIMKRGFF